LKICHYIAFLLIPLLFCKHKRSFAGIFVFPRPIAGSNRAQLNNCGAEIIEADGSAGNMLPRKNMIFAYKK
jgi:hypothetical protein